VLTNINHSNPPARRFRKAIEADPKYAPAQYQLCLYLVSKARCRRWQTDAAPGTKEAFQKYLELEPTGPFAEQPRPC
jgi:hypothetical protein